MTSRRNIAKSRRQALQMLSTDQCRRCIIPYAFYSFFIMSIVVLLILFTDNYDTIFTLFNNSSFYLILIKLVDNTKSIERYFNTNLIWTRLVLTYTPHCPHKTIVSLNPLTFSSTQHFTQYLIIFNRFHDLNTLNYDNHSKRTTEQYHRTNCASTIRLIVATLR